MPIVLYCFLSCRMASYTDQMGRRVTVNFPPRKIVSVVPSQTELLADLGLEKEVVGITKFCIHPQKWFKEKRRVGGTKQLHLETIKALEPDLIIANKEENDEEQIRTLAKLFPVWISDIKTLPEALSMIRSVGTITGKSTDADIIADAINDAFAGIYPSSTRRVAYFIWRKPYMVAAGDTFINDLLNRAGFENVFGTLSRYPEVRLSEINNMNCDYLFLSSEPYPFQEKHFNEFSALITTSKPVLVDGEMFSWYGSRLLKAARYIQELNARLS